MPITFSRNFKKPLPLPSTLTVQRAYTSLSLLDQDTIIYFDNYTTAEQLKTLSQALVANLLDETLWKGRKVFKSSSALEGGQKSLS